MEFLNVCLGALLQLVAHTPFVDQGVNQQPLPLSPQPTSRPDVTTVGVSFAPQGATAGFTCQYPSLDGWQSCNSPSDRSCWLDDPQKREALSQYNITTDYEQFSPPGVQREYWLTTSVTPISPDGYVKPLGQVFNGTFPGPVLEACWGDELLVHVTNNIGQNGDTVHWHGVRQLGTNQMDGVNGVTQCPIAQNDTFTYRFKIEQYGHTWYHSHYQTTYSDGLAAGLTLYGPSSSDYDEALEPQLINDWVHENTSIAFREELNRGIPVMSNIMFGGNGTFLCSDTDPRCCSACVLRPGATLCTPDPACSISSNPTGSRTSLTFSAGKRYLLRLINASAESMFIFSIDGHELEVIATDLVPIKPYKTSSLFIGIGQRYQIIVQASPSPAAADGNYWIRTRVAIGCGNVAQNDETTGIVRYDPASTATPTTNPNDFRSLCEDEPTASLVPVVPWQIDDLQGDIRNFTFEADQTTTLDHGFIRWDLLDQALFLNYSDPTILHTDNPSFQYRPDYCIVPYNYTRGYVYLVITGENLTINKTHVPAAHPIHLHGHDFVILAQENNATFNYTASPPNFNLDNPPRRDVALLYAGGYLALAFRPDNPGVWLVHCHIAWHASSGLALQVLERESEIVDSLGGEGALQVTRNGCEKWDEWDLQFAQDDSGI